MVNSCIKRNQAKRTIPKVMFAGHLHNTKVKPEDPNPKTEGSKPKKKIKTKDKNVDCKHSKTCIVKNCSGTKNCGIRRFMKKYPNYHQQIIA